MPNNVRERIEDILEDLRDKVIKCQDRNLPSRPYTDKALDEIFSAIRTLLVGEIKNKKKQIKNTDVDWRVLAKDGFNSGLSQAIQVVEDKCK